MLVQYTHLGRAWLHSGGGLYAFYHEMERAIATATGFQKSIGFQFIQAGFPVVLHRKNYLHDTDRGHFGTALDNHLLPGAHEQARVVMDLAQSGYFADPGGATADPVAGKLFVPQHSGLQSNPYDRPGDTDVCPQSKFAMPDTAYPYHSAFPMPGSWTLNALGDVGSGCPNKWITLEGHEGQVIGFQTINQIGDLDQVNSALWNATANSDAVFLELYIKTLWGATHTRGTGPAALPLDPDYDNPSRQFPGRPKNLYDWNEELHARRKWIADNNAANPHLADPFPASYSYTFDKNLAPGTSETYHFVSPYKCLVGGTDSPDRIGRITVIGN